MDKNTQVIAKSKLFDIQSSESLKNFIQSVTVRNKRTAVQYNFRLLFFERFLKEKYNINLDDILQKIKLSEYNPYDVLNDYCIYLQNNYNIGTLAFRDKIITVKTFLEYNDIEINPKKFKLEVRFPKTVLRHKEAIDKGDIIKILNGSSDLRLNTHLDAL